MGEQMRFAGLGIVLSVLLINPVAADDAGNKKEAQQHFKTATRLYKVEDYDGAVSEFEASVRLYPTKNGYFNLANCYKALHRYHEALAAVDKLERFLKKLNIPVIARIRDTQHYVSAAGQGLGIHELNARDTKKDRITWAELLLWLDNNQEGGFIDFEYEQLHDLTA